MPYNVLSEMEINAGAGKKIRSWQLRFDASCQEPEFVVTVYSNTEQIWD